MAIYVHYIFIYICLGVGVLYGHTIGWDVDRYNYMVLNALGPLAVFVTLMRTKLK